MEPVLLFCVRFYIKFIYSEKATKFCEIFTFLLSYVVPVKSKVKISQNCGAFSEYMNFKSCVKNKSSILYILERQQKLEKSTYELYSHHSLKIFNSKRGVKILITSKIEITPNTMNKKSSN